MKSTRKFKHIPKHIDNDELNDKKSYLIELNTYYGYDKELQDVKSPKILRKILSICHLRR